MSELFGFAFIFIMVYVVYRKLNNRVQEEVFRTNMFKLRDDLRNLAIDNAIDVESREFDYLDFSISRNIEMSYYINFFFLLFLEFRHSSKTHGDYRKAYETLHADIQRNALLNAIFDRKNEITFDYLIGQHSILVSLMISCRDVITTLFGWKNVIKRRVAEVNYLPELSGIGVPHPYKLSL